MPEQLSQEEIELKIDSMRGSPSPGKRALTLTPETKRRIITAEYNNEYTCCCTDAKTDRRLLDFTSKYILSLFILGFACYNISVAKECDSLVPFYSSLITFVLGVWLKKPESKGGSTGGRSSFGSMPPN